MALNQEANDIVFHFARSAPFTVDDKKWSSPQNSAMWR